VVSAVRPKAVSLRSRAFFKEIKHNMGEHKQNSQQHSNAKHDAGHASSAGHHEEHKGLVNTPKQLIVVSVLALLVPVMLAYLGSQWASGDKRMNKTESAESIAKRIAPTGEIKKFDPNEPAPVVAAAVATSDKPKSGEEVYTAGCNACHGAGIAGAPKMADKEAWGARIAQGASTLYDHAIKGYQGKGGMMPAKGGNTALSDAEVKAAVDHMVAAAK
jgi:cytochrome c5